MLKVGFSESTMFKEGRPLWGLLKSRSGFNGGIRQCGTCGAGYRSIHGGQTGAYKFAGRGTNRPLSCHYNCKCAAGLRPSVLLDLQSSRIVLWRFVISISFSGLQILKKPRFGIARADETAGRINPAGRIARRRIRQ